MIALVAPAVLLVPAAAHAEKVETTDPAQDVVGVLLGVEEGVPEQTVPAPDQAAPDVVRTVVDHRTRLVRVRVELRDLATGAPEATVLHLRTPSGRFEVESDSLDRPTTTEMTKGSRAVECRGLRSVIDRAADRITLTVPTRCIGAPRWVQAGVGVVSLGAFLAEPASGEPMAYADDAHRAGTIKEDTLTLGPKVRRG